MRMTAAIRRGLMACLAILAIPSVQTLQAQSVVISATHDYALGFPGPLLVIDDLTQAWSDPEFIPTYLAPSAPHVLNPHGFALLDAQHAVAANAGKNWVNLINLTDGTIDGFFMPAGNDYSGYGSLALSPDGSHLLLAPGATISANGNREKLWVVATPLHSLSSASHSVTLPGEFGTAQLSAIAFDPDTGRAYVAHSNGVSAIDPPYEQADLVFTLSLPALPLDPSNAIGRSLALAPDRSALLSTESSTGRPLTVIAAPFSAASNIETIAIASAEALDGIAFTPNSDRALIVDRERASVPMLGRTQMFSIEAPFNSASMVDRLVFDDTYENVGYEHVAISPDGSVALLSGGGGIGHEDVRIVKAPFTTDGFSSRRIAISALGTPYGPGGRGAGMAMFSSTPISTLPQLSIDHGSILEGDSSNPVLRFSVTLSKSSLQPVSVDYSTMNVSALSGIDYAAQAGTLTFPAGARKRDIDIEIVSNLVAEPNRLFRVAITNAVNAQLLRTSVKDGDGLIIDDDDASRAVIVTESPLPDAEMGVAYASAPFNVINLVVTSPPLPRWQVSGGDNPPGLSMDINSGVLSGLPERVGDYYFPVLVAGDFPQVAQREYRIRVRGPTNTVFSDGFEAP